MSVRNVFLILLLGILALFTALNWAAFTQVTTLSLVFGNVQAPLGLLMLGVVALLTAFFLLYIAYLQSTVIMESRRTARELQAQRQLADDAEASRLAELRTFLDTRMSNLDAELLRSRGLAQDRIDQLSSDVHATVQQSATVLTSYIGEVEDRLERTLSKEGNPLAR